MLETLRELKNDKLAVIGLAIILFLLVIALLAPYIVPYDPVVLDLECRLSSPSTEHLMGTDTLGRDTLSRVVYGTRVSLMIATIVVAVEVLLGVLLGTIAGYLGGVIDGILMRLVDVLLAFPGLILALVIVGVLGPSLVNLAIALVAVGWVRYARVIRGSILSFKERGFVETARAIVCSNMRIATRHILPNVLSPIIVLATLNMGSILLSIAGLSFLGLGAQPPTPEWGAMLNEGRPFMETAPHLMVFPGLMIMITVLAFNFLGDGLRDALDPRMKDKVEI